MTKREAEELLELSRKATPGPWQRKGLHIYAGTRGQVAQIPRPQNGGVFECTANAELIPELRNRIESLAQMLQQAAEIIEDPDKAYFRRTGWLSEWNKPEQNVSVETVAGGKGEEPKP